MRLRPLALLALLSSTALLAEEPHRVPVPPGIGEERQALACPTGSIPNFLLTAMSCAETACTKTFSWGAPTGADSTTEYEVYHASAAGDYCNFDAITNGFRLLGSTTQRGVQVTGIPTNVLTGTFIRVKGCASV